MQNYQNYERTIYNDTEESLSKIVNKIPDYSIVLDVGCSTGMLGRHLAEKKGCIVDGVDFDTDAIDISRPKYRFTAVKNLESESLTDIFKTEAYDYIVVADVIEHLVNPDYLLSELKQLVKPHGTVIFSVPNITHISSGFELLLGHFDYSANGLLDNTHLRFYSKQTLLKKLEAFGLYAWEIDTVQKNVEETEFSDHISKFFPDNWLDELISYREDALTYQWLISTKIYPNVIEHDIKATSLDTRKPPLVFTAALYWANEDTPDLTEQNKLIGHLVNENEELTVIDFYFSECGDINGLQKIRVNPVSNQKPFLISNAEILDAEKKVVWTWKPPIIDSEIHGACTVKYFDSVGHLFQATDSDTQWLPSIEQKILDNITAGWIFRLSLKVDTSLLNELTEQITIFQQRQDELEQLIDQVSSFQQRQNKHLIEQTTGFQQQQNKLKKHLIEQTTGFQQRLIEQTTSFQQRENELKKQLIDQTASFQQQESELRNKIEALYASTSWKITKPLRYVSQKWQQIKQRYVYARSGKEGIKSLQHDIASHDVITHETPALNQLNDAYRIDLLHTLIKKGLILNSTILFDHNGGGGANTYTDELVKIIHADGGVVLRVYYFESAWFVQWTGDQDNVLFFTPSIKELFEVLSISHSASIILNSLYGYPDIKEASENIVSLVHALNATLDFKIHDFYALCPSPHLSDFEDKYCGVPKDVDVCAFCLQKNLAWYHSWYPEENRPIDINEWRKPFAALFEVATTITFFDLSSIDIVRKAFYLEENKIKVIPHIIKHFKCDKQIDVTGPLHIATLGMLSHMKGGNIVKALGEYIHEQGLNIPITVVGSSFVDTPPEINIYGSYIPNDLPEIISERKINVILMPSIIPETFSYTISEAMEMELPIVAFDLGAQGNRVKQYALGKVVPLGSSPATILAAIQSVLKIAQEKK